MKCFKTVNFILILLYHYQFLLFLSCYDILVPLYHNCYKKKYNYNNDYFWWMMVLFYILTVSMANRLPYWSATWRTQDWFPEEIFVGHIYFSCEFECLWVCVNYYYVIVNFMITRMLLHVVKPPLPVDLLCYNFANF